MDHQQQIAGQRRDDRLSNLGDGTLGHILSFLDTREAARAAALSSRWRDVLASVHTVSMEEPESPIPDYDNNNNGGYYNRKVPSPTPFPVVVTAALFARSSRAAPAASPVPLRALRVSMEGYGSAFTVDQWVTYALKHATPELEIDLRLRRDFPVCMGSHPICAAISRDEYKADHGTLVAPVSVDDEDDVASSTDEEELFRLRYEYDYVPPPGYTVPAQLFSCAALRSLHLGSCRLSPPAAFNMPSLETLRLTHVPDEQEHVQRLISACPRLVGLTLVACQTVTALSLLDNTLLRRLALWCCHKLDTVAVDDSELRSFDYRGGVPGSSLLPVRAGGGGLLSIPSCKVDICTVCLDEAEATSSEQLATLCSFLQMFASTRHLHLCTARMGSCLVDLPVFTSLRHLQLNGHAQHDDKDHAAAAIATTRILHQAPNLEVLTLFFEAGPHHAELQKVDRHQCYSEREEWELLDAHHLQYNQYESLDYTPVVPPCLANRVRRINLVHYQGGRAQRMLARFLLRNAALLEKLYCEFAQGPMWIQVELMSEMEGWVVNQKASKYFR